MSIKLPSYFRITSDSVFKFVFKRKQYAKHLIEKILGQTILSIKSVEVEKVVTDNNFDAKGVSMLFQFVTKLATKIVMI